jgi:hypothetical protein
MIADWHRPKSNWETEIMKKKIYWTRIVNKTDYICFFINYLGFILAPLTGFDLRSITNITDHGNYHFMIQSYYPYDCTKSPYFELTYLSQVITAIFISMCVSIPDHYFGALIFHTSTQFVILGSKIANCIQDDDIILAKTQDKYIDKKLGIFVERHVHLIKYVHNKLFKLIIIYLL